MANISIPGGTGSGSGTITFTVTGNSATNYAEAFNAAVANATTIVNLGDGGQPSTVAGALNIIMGSGTSHYSLATPGQYTYAAVTAPTQINGSAGGDTILGGGNLYYVAAGGDNNITFNDGDNVFFGSAVGGNTIAGGTGYDTINTGTGSDTVFAGPGHSLINLTDLTGGDLVSMLTGNTTVNSYGVNDTVYASAALDPTTTGTIFGSAGTLTFVAGSSANTLAVTVVGGSGKLDMFGGNNANIVFANTDGSATFIAGTGNETLNGTNASGDFSVFGDTVPADAASINDSIYGGSGTDFFSTGGGQETYIGGTGGALFHINDLGSGTDITIANFGATDYVNFAGLSTDAETSLLQTASVVSNGNLTVTLQNGTQVEFLSTTSLTGHLV